MKKYFQIQNYFRLYLTVEICLVDLADFPDSVCPDISRGPSRTSQWRTNCPSVWRIFARDVRRRWKSQSKVKTKRANSYYYISIFRKIVGSDGTSRTEDKVLTIEVKPGWKSGTRITFPKEGDVYPNRVEKSLTKQYWLSWLIQNRFLLTSPSSSKTNPIKSFVGMEVTFGGWGNCFTLHNDIRSNFNFWKV